MTAECSTPEVAAMFHTMCPCRVPVDSPQRFRIELLFSPGAAFNPYEVVPLHKDHTLPVQPRACLHKGETGLHGVCTGSTSHCIVSIGELFHALKDRSLDTAVL